MSTTFLTVKVEIPLSPELLFGCILPTILMISPGLGGVKNNEFRALDLDLVKYCNGVVFEGAIFLARSSPTFVK